MPRTAMAALLRQVHRRGVILMQPGRTLVRLQVCRKRSHVHSDSRTLSTYPIASRGLASPGAYMPPAVYLPVQRGYITRGVYDIRGLLLRTRATARDHIGHRGCTVPIPSVRPSTSVTRALDRIWVARSPRRPGSTAVLGEIGRP